MKAHDHSVRRDRGAVNLRFLLISAAVVLLVALAIGGLYLWQRASSPRLYLEEMQRAIADHDLERAITLFEKAEERGHRPISKIEKQTIARIYMNVTPPRLDKAIALFESAAEQDPGDVELRVILARLHAEAGNPDAARKFGRSAIENASPSTWQDHLLLVDAHWLLAGLAPDREARAAELNGAETHLRAAVDLGGPALDPYRMAIGSWRLHGSMIGGPNLRDFLRQRVSRLNEGDRRRIEAAADEWLGRVQDGCGDLMIYADLCALLDRWPAAAGSIRAFLERSTEAGDGGCLAALSYIASEAGDLVLAIELREAAVALDPQRSPATALMLARALQRRGDRDRAVVFLEESVSLAAEDPAVLGDIVILNVDLGRFDEAESALQILEDDGDAATLGGLRAYVALRRGRAREALALLAEGAAAAGERTPPWYDFVRGEALAGIGDLAGAKEALLRAWRSGSEVAGLKLVLADILARARDFRGAEQWIADHELTVEAGSVRAALLRARIALAQGQARAAEERLRGILAASADHADHAEALYLLGSILRDTGRAAEARGWFERAAGTADPRFATAALVESARLVRAAGDLPGARDLAEAALHKDPASAEALQLRDEVALAQGDPSTIDARLAANPEDATALEAMARRALADRSAAAAEDALRRCLAGEDVGTDRWKRLWWSWISVLVSEERIEDAEQALAQARAEIEHDPVLDYVEALLASARGDHEASIPSWESYLGSQPGDVNARMLFASSLLRVGRAARAAEQARQVVAAGARSDGSWVLLADALYRSGDLDAALKAAEDGLERFPDSVELLSGAAELYQAAGQVDRAIQLRRQLTQAAPDRRENYLGLAELALLSGDPSAAIRWVREGAGEDRTPRAVFLDALAQFRMGNRAEADLLVEDYARQQPDDADVAWRVARYFNETGRPEQALAWFDRAIDARPADVSLQVDRANALARCGRSDEAIGILASLEEQDPGNVQVALGRITVLFGADRFEEALEDVRGLLADRAEVKEAHRLESQILMALGRLDEAEDALARGRRLLGDTAADDYVEAGILLRRLNRMPGSEARMVLSAARESLRRVARRRPDLSELWTMLARISLELRDPRDAMASIERLDRLAAVDEEACLLAVRASAMMADRRTELAWRERLSEIDAGNIGNWIEIASRRLELGEREGAVEAAREAAARDALPDPALAQRLAGLLLALQRDGEADRILDSYAEKKGAAAADAMRARALLDAGRYREAEALTAGILQDHAADPAIWQARALVMEVLGRQEEGLAAYERAASLDPGNEERACDHASALARSGAAAEAMNLVRAVLADHPDSLRGRILLGELLASEQRWDEAIAVAQQVRERRPDLPEGILWEARILARAAVRPGSGISWQKAMEVLDTVPRDTAYFDEALLLRAQIQAERGLLVEASELVRSLLRRRPDSAAALQLGVGILIRRQSFREAQEMVDDSARRSAPAPVHAELSGRIALAAARAAAARGESAGAVEWLRRGEPAYRYLAEVRPDEPGAWLGLAEVLAMQERWDEAETAMAHWVGADAAPGTVVQWSRILRRGGRAAGADALLDGWIEANAVPVTPVHRERVDVLLSRGRNEDALSLASRFAESDPRSANALMMLAQALLVAGDGERAVETSRRAAAVEEVLPPELLERHAAVLFETGHRDEAVEALTRVLADEPARPMAMNNLAWILAVGEPPDLNRALELVRRARAIAPDDPSILDTEGMVQWKLGDPRFAADLFRRSIERRPSPAVRLRLAETLAAVGQRDDAVREARAVLASAPPSEVRDDAQAFLQRIGAGD